MTRDMNRSSEEQAINFKEESFHYRDEAAEKFHFPGVPRGQCGPKDLTSSYWPAQ